MPPRNAAMASSESGRPRAASSAFGSGRNGWSEPYSTLPWPRDDPMNFTRPSSMYFDEYAVVERWRFGHFIMYWISRFS